MFSVDFITLFFDLKIFVIISRGLQLDPAGCLKDDRDYFVYDVSDKEVLVDYIVYE